MEKFTLTNQDPSLGIFFYKGAGITIILSLYQPSAEILSMIDKLISMQGGKFVYQGSPKDSIKYFSEIGFEVPKFIISTDYYLRILHISNRNDLNSEEIDKINIFEKKYKENYLYCPDGPKFLQINESYTPNFFQSMKYLLWREFIN